MGKVVEIPADMTARDLCQFLVYKSHCVDNNSWALVEHHPLLGLGKDASPAGTTHSLHAHKHTPALGQAPACCVVAHRHTQLHPHIHMRAYPHIWADGLDAYYPAGMYSSMSACTYCRSLCTHGATLFRDLIKCYTWAAVAAL